MKIRMKRDVEGAFHGLPGVKFGDVVEVDDANGARYCALGYAEPVVDRKEERAVAPEGEERAEPKKAVNKAVPAKPADA